MCIVRPLLSLIYALVSMTYHCIELKAFVCKFITVYEYRCICCVIKIENSFDIMLRLCRRGDLVGRYSHGFSKVNVHCANRGEGGQHVRGRSENGTVIKVPSLSRMFEQLSRKFPLNYFARKTKLKYTGKYPRRYR